MTVIVLDRLKMNNKQSAINNELSEMANLISDHERVSND